MKQKLHLTAYGEIDEGEVIVDDAACVLLTLITACKKKMIPGWAKELLDQIEDGRLLAAVEKLLK